MKKNFKVFDFNSPEFDVEIAKQALPYGGNHSPFKNILEQLSQSPLNCKSVVFEYDYVDKDYLDEFSAFYCKSFKQYPSRSVRLLFFSTLIPKQTRIGFQKYAKGFLGFMVLRPTDLQRVGRTLLKPPIQNSHNEFIHCLAAFKTHIFGDSFPLEAMPFIQQDTQVGACAQASLWMLARYMSRRFGYRQYNPSEINHLAKSNQAHGRHLPASAGLFASQMLDALQGMNFPAMMYSRANVDSCSPHIDHAYPVAYSSKDENLIKRELDEQRTAKLADIAYRYLESSLPVILGTSDHALIAIGHTYLPQVPNLCASIQRIPDFYVNNDASGPYIKMPIFKNGVSGLTFEDVQTIITILPREVTLRGEEAERMAITYIDKLLASTPSKTLREMLETYRPEFKNWFSAMEYRTYLRSSIQHQKDLKSERQRKVLPAKIADKLRVLDYPKYVWITEISSPDLLNHTDKMSRQCLGRVVVDATAPANTMGVLSAHFADILCIEDRVEGLQAREVHHFSTPFKHLLI